MWGEVPLPEDLEAAKVVKASHTLLDDDEDFAADEASGGGKHKHNNSCLNFVGIFFFSLHIPRMINQAQN